MSGLLHTHIHIYKPSAKRIWKKNAYWYWNLRNFLVARIESKSVFASMWLQYNFCFVKIADNSQSMECRSNYKIRKSKKKKFHLCAYVCGYNQRIELGILLFLHITVLPVLTLWWLMSNGNTWYKPIQKIEERRQRRCCILHKADVV